MSRCKHMCNVAGFPVYYDTEADHWWINTGQFPSSTYRTHFLSTLVSYIRDSLAKGDSKLVDTHKRGYIKYEEV